MILIVVVIVIGIVAVIAIFNAKAKHKDSNGPMNNN
jgi:type II secretory pathway pseudopilin PulG